jgi:TPR repeat protein
MPHSIKKGEADAQFNLGGLYRNGERDWQDDYAKEALCTRKAAAQGDAKAQYNIAYFYSRGRGVPQDNAQAAFWNRKAAEQGYVMAQHMLGYTYRYGLGVTEDYAEACFWFDLASAGELDATTAKINAENREEVASHLTPAELSRIQERVREWFFGA